MRSLARRASLLSAALSLAVPAAAAARDFTVDPSVGGGACSGATCPTIQSAVDAAAAGDRIVVRKGTYAESPTVTKALTIQGAGPGEVKVVGSGSGDVLTLGAPGIALSGMTVEVPAGGGSAIAAPAGDTTISDVVAQRGESATADRPAVAVGGGAAITRSFVVQAGGKGSPGLASTGTGGVVLTDTLVLSSTGSGVVLTESDRNRLVRATVASSAAGAEGLRFAAASSAAAKRVVVDSSFLIGGPGGAALAVVTAGGNAGDVTVAGRHVTAFGAKGAVLDASRAQGNQLDGPSGGIAASFTASIVHGPSVTKEFVPSLPLLQAPNEVSLSFSASDAPPATGDGRIDMGGASHTDPGRLFIPGSLRLRVDAPVIDKGGAPAPDESGLDVEGDPRVAGAASDIGADEFVNKPPVARFGIANPAADVGQDVGFISGSTDPEQDGGGGIVEYRWDFGDGTKRTTDKLGVVHRYAAPGSYKVTLQVVDRQGAVSAVSAPQTVTIGEPGKGPELRIAVPARGQRVTLRRPGGRPPLPLTVLGSWSDPQGIRSVELSLRLVARDGTRSARRSAARACTFVSGRRLVRRSCTQPVWVAAAVKDRGFALQTPARLRLPAGRYELRVRGTDAAGNPSAAPSAAAGTLVRFRIR